MVDFVVLAVNARVNFDSTFTQSGCLTGKRSVKIMRMSKQAEDRIDIKTG